MTRVSAFACLPCLALVALVASPGVSRSSAAATRPHVIVIVMENRSYDQVRTTRYTASLIKSGSVMTKSYAVTHPSQPNYLALWAGGTLGVKDNACPPLGSPFKAENLGHACEAAGLTWKAYSEDLPAPGSAACESDEYVRKHDPWTNFGNLDHKNERPFTDFAADVAAGKLPSLAFVIPNECHNTHDCPVSEGDSWLADHVPAMLAALGRGGFLVLTWDEDDHSASNHILTVFAGPGVRAGYASSQKVTHYTVLRTICERLGIKPFGSAASEKAISDIWSDAAPGSHPTQGAPKSSKTR